MYNNNSCRELWVKERGIIKMRDIRQYLNPEGNDPFGKQEQQGSLESGGWGEIGFRNRCINYPLIGSENPF